MTTANTQAESWEIEKAREFGRLQREHNLPTYDFQRDFAIDLIHQTEARTIARVIDEIPAEDYFLAYRAEKYGGEWAEAYEGFIERMYQIRRILTTMQEDNQKGV